MLFPSTTRPPPPPLPGAFSQSTTIVVLSSWGHLLLHLLKKAQPFLSHTQQRRAPLSLSKAFKLPLSLLTHSLKSRHSFGACKFSQFSRTENCPLLQEREMGISPRRAEGAKWNICSSVLLVAKINGDEKKVLIEKLIAELYFLSCVSLCAVVSSPLSKRWMTESCMHFLSLPLSLSHRYTVQLPLLLPSSLTPPSPITELNSILCCLNMTEQNALC